MTDIEKTLNDLKLLNALCHGTVLDDAIALLTGQPQVVRCKDCKHRNTIFCFKDEQGFGTDDDWFCADGAKKDA